MKKIFIVIAILPWVFAGNYKYQENITILSVDGTKISANLFTPEGEGTFPLIIFPNSWAMDEHQYYVQASLFAEKGYVVFSYSSRGWGKSGGTVTVAGPEDLEDLSSCLDWVLANAPVDEKNIGISGISYGAGISLLGLAHDNRIKTAAVMSVWGDLIQSLYGNETPHVVWATVLLGSGYLTGNMDPMIYEHYQNLVKRKDIPKTLAWAKKRSPLYVLDKINKRKAPVYISNNLQDEMFQPNSVVELYEKLTVPKRLDLNLGIHASAELGGLLGIDNYVWKNAHLWFDHWLKGQDNRIMEQPPVTIAVKNTGERDSFGAWPHKSIRAKQYFFSQRTILENGTLVSKVPSRVGKDKISSGILSGITTGIPIIGAIFEAHSPIPIITFLPTTNPIISIYYQSEPLPAKFQLRGTPKVEIWVKPSDKQVQMIAHLYKLDSFGFATLMTHAPITLHDQVPGKAVKVTWDLVTTAYDLKKGDRFALAIDNYDLNYKSPSKYFSTEILCGENFTSNIIIPYTEKP
ncbi:CocE/NonD family hydrolase [Candidatus Uabimicrobium sp. HlEnr_7]|uniref:CocE/NonD family hydrolase n=1 Tax=Candidatus Uabimicrobium helgolandensis TaxID=3095367 RepID=UPI00355812AF